MATVELVDVRPHTPFPENWSLADLQDFLGGVGPERIRLTPPPGTATENDALKINDRKEAICELIDGTLVEKILSTYESMLAIKLAISIEKYLEDNPLGILTGGDGELWILPTQMRVPDLAFISWDRFPEGKLPKDRVYKIVPDLAVEILSPGNTRREMDQKLDDYFQAGVRLVWYIDPADRTARIFTAREQITAIDESGNLDGGKVLPGFSINLGDLFRRTERRVDPS